MLRRHLHPPYPGGRNYSARQFANGVADVIQSIPMHRWFFGFFFYFPRHLAEGNG
jgi:hypothetical protein